MDREQIRESIRRNNLVLLGQIDVDNKGYSELLEYARDKIKWMNSTSKARSDLLMALFMVQVAIRKYDERAYWKVLKEEIGVKHVNQVLLGDIFLKTLKKHNLMCLDKGNKYVENIKIHSFVPNGYMQGYFDFAYAFFENNLFRQINDDELHEDIQDISEYMKSTLDNDSDTFLIENEKKRVAKTYKLLKATRVVFANGDIDTITNLFKPTLEMIDKYYYDNVVPDKNSNRFARYFFSWCKNSEQISEKRRKKGEERNLYSRNPYIEIVHPEETYARLIIPPQKFRQSECNGNASVRVKISGYEKIEEKELDLGSYFGMYISEKCEFRIPNIFEEIEVTVLPNEKVYSIKKSNYRVFNKHWKNTSKLKMEHNYILVKKDVDVRWNNEVSLVDSFEGYASWKYYSVNITEKSVCFIGNKPVSIIGEFSFDPVFEKEIDSFEVLEYNGEKITATRQHPSISFVIERYKNNGTSLIVNNKKYHLYNLQQKVCYDWPSDKRKNAITINLNEVLEEKEGKYSVILDAPGEQNREICKYIFLKDLRINLDRTRYMYKEYAYVSYSGEYNMTPIDMQHDTENIYDEGFYKKLLTPETKYLEFVLSLGEKYIIRKELKIFLYGPSKNQMQIGRLDYIWYDDLEPILYVKMPGANKLWVCFNKDKIIYPGEQVDKSVFRVDITEIREHVRANKRPWNYINVYYVDNRERHISLPPILKGCFINPYFKLKIEEEKVYIDIEEIKGKGEIFLTIKEKDEVIVEHRKIEQGNNYIPELEFNKMYNLYPTTEEKKGFFGDKKVSDLKILRDVGAVDLNNLVNCALPIEYIINGGEELNCKSKYTIYLYKKNNIDEYYGMLKEKRTYCSHVSKAPKKVYVPVGQVKVQMYIDEEDIHATLLMYSKEDEEYLEPYYDKLTGKIIRCDSDLVNRNRDYSRFETLFEDETIFRITEDKIRRYK